MCHSKNKTANMVVRAAVASGLGLLAVACAEDAFDKSPAADTVISAVIADGGDKPQSRTCIDPATYSEQKFVGVLWSHDDSLGVYSGATANAIFRRTGGGNAKKADFKGSVSGAPLYAYYPYSAANDGRPASDLLGEVDALQPFNPVDGRLVSDYKTGVPESGSDSRFSFRHLFSLLRITIDASGTVAEGEKLDYVKLSVASSDGAERAIAGKFHFDASSPEPRYFDVSSASSAITMPWTGNPVLAPGSTMTGFVTAIPDIRKGDKLTMTVATENRLVSFTTTCSVDFIAGYVYDFPMTLDLYEDRKEYGWTEAKRAAITSFGFSAAANSGKILDKKVVNSGTSYSVNSVTREEAAIDGSEISLCIPYLYDYHLKPEFTAPEGAVVTCGQQVVVSGETEIDFAGGPKEFKIVTDADTRTYRVSIVNSGLPVVVINQSASGDFSLDDAGNIFNHKYRNQFLDFKIRKKGSEWVTDDHIAIYNPDGTVDMPDMTCGVRQRGNSTRKYPKKALAVKLTSKSAALGMPSSKRWVLLANWIDHSVIRNAAGFALADLIRKGVEAEGLEPGIPWNPSGRNVELVIDGRHVGNYLFAEQVKVEKKRLNIKDSFEDRQKDGKSTAFEDCGYLLEFDQSYDEPWKFKTAKSSIPVQIKDDVIGGDAAGKELWARVQAKVNGIEANLLAGNYSQAYEDYDIYSAIDQWLVYELVQNREYTEPRSVYCYINGGGKLSAGPVWDFDRGTFHNPAKAREMGNETNRIKPYDQWLSEFSTGASGTTPGVWYRSLIKDPVFKAAVKARWAKLLPYLRMMPEEIVRLGETNRVSWEYNNAMWPTTADVRKAGNDGSTFKDWAGDEWMATYDEVIYNMVECYEARLNGLNTLIEKL